MKKEQTVSLPPTDGIEISEYQSQFLKIINTEFSGEYKTFDHLEEEAEEILRK